MVPNSEMISCCFRRRTYSSNAALTASFLVRCRPNFWASSIRRSSMARFVGISTHYSTHLHVASRLKLEAADFVAEACTTFYNRAFHRQGGTVPVGTAFHERTLALCESLSYREWSGYYTVSVYETHHEHEYNAIRNSAALIDISPLFKYRVTGRDASKFVNRVISRDINKVAVDQVIYCCWCDPEGKVIDDGTITRLGENEYRWTAADPSLRWFRQNALGLDVTIEDISEQVAALALQGPTSGKLLRAVTDANIANLKYFRVAHGKIAGVAVDISRTGYTGDLGFEIWMPWKDALRVWDKLVNEGEVFDIHPAGMIALDVARIEAGLILIEVDYTSSKKALIDAQKFSPAEIGLGKLVDLKKDNFVGREALALEAKKG